MALALIPIDKIEIGTRLRNISEAQVEALVSSIGDVGLLNPVTLYPRDQIVGGETIPAYGLVAGAHRLEACKRLGLVEIEAQVVELGDLERQIAECDENLCGTVLSKSERALFTKRRKDAYEALHPETKNGAAGRGRKKVRQVGEANDGPADRFTSDTAKSTGQSERAVQRDAERGERVIEEALDTIRGTRLDTGTYLDKIKKLTPNDQVAAVKRDIAMDAKEAREKAKAEKAVKKAAREAEQGELDRKRQANADALPQHIKDSEQAKAEWRARAKAGADAEAVQDRIAELEEANRVLEAEAEALRAENKTYGEMKVQFGKGGFEAVIAGKDEEIRVLETRLFRESEDKASWMRSAKYWKAEAQKLGWSRDEVIDIETGEVVDD